jgi:UPF0755 protein
MRRKLFTLVLPLLIVVLGGGAELAYYVYSQLAPVQSGQSPKLLFAVARNESLTEVAASLQERHLVRNNFFFKLYADFKGLAPDLKAGKFALDSGMSVSEIVKVLKGPPQSQAFNVTVPDGLRAAQEAQLLQAEGLFSASSYLREVNHPAVFPGITPLQGAPAAASWEGFAFGDTFQVLPKITPYEMLQKQLEDFDSRVRQKIIHGAPAVGLTPYQVVVLASIVSAEAATVQDRGLVAGVFFNRLHDDMMLQSDVTVLYAQSLGGDDSTVVNTNFASPYNTYINSGLPPGPIDSPGITAINAVLHPTSTDYLYFLALPNGKVLYSVTLAEHNQQIQENGLG